jgi:hypothetical protein
MTTRRAEYSKEESARRGREWYRTVIRPKLRAKHKGKYVAIDLDTGEYEIADELLAANAALRVRLPGAQTWTEWIGYLAAGSFVGRTPEDPEWSPAS